MFNRLMVLILLAMTGAPAAAHDDHVGPHGGYVKHFGSVEVELVTDGPKVIVHVRDEKTAKPVVLAANAGGRAVVLMAGKTETVPLRPDGATLVGVAKAPIGASAKVALALDIPGRDDVPSTTFDLSKKPALPTRRPE
jgi:glycine/D-amino acid oxidase-like deaminating enzyme